MPIFKDFSVITPRMAAALELLKKPVDPTDPVDPVDPVDPTDPVDPGAFILGVSSEGGWHRIDVNGNPVTVDGVIDKANGKHTYFDDMPIYKNIRAETLISNVGNQSMVRIPQFWFKREGSGLAGSPYKLWISDREIEGFKKHPAFALKDHFHVGAYACGGNYYNSLPGLSPKVLMSFSSAAINIPSRHGSGWALWDVFQLSAIQMLFLVEFGSPDAQLVIGSGCSSGSSLVSNGGSNAIYRGMYELWANVWQMLDGVRTSSGTGEIEIWPSGHRYYVPTGLIPPAANDSAIRSVFTNRSDSFDMGCVHIGRSDGESPFFDSTWGFSPGSVAWHGGSFHYGDSCGLFSLCFINGETISSNSHVGCRMSKI